MTELTLVDEICADHEHILAALQSCSQCRHTKRSSIRELTVRIGAHHLAEEDTLYGALRAIAIARVGEAHVYHKVLDDLTHTIECGGVVEEPLRYQLLLLEHLLQDHFLMEEAQLLELFVGTFPRGQQVALGRLYRQRYLENVAVLGSRSGAAQLRPKPVTGSLI